MIVALPHKAFENGFMEANWDDLKLFMVVAEGGGLSAAAARTGISAPTIGRRMLALERTMNRMLFERSRLGYELAVDGKTLLARVREMERVASDIQQWHAGAFQDPYVGVAGDAWMSRFLANNGKALSRGMGDVRYCAHDAHTGLNLVNRDADIAVITDPPNSGNFAIRPSINVAYAIYQHPSLGRGDGRMWVSLGKEEASSPADRWVFERYDNDISSWSNSPHVVLEMIRSGQGRGVLPCFIGDLCADLERDGGILEDLTAQLHIVVNDDDRQRSEIRTMMDRIAKLLEENMDLFAGTLVTL